MRKTMVLLLVILCTLELISCSQKSSEPYVVNTFKATPEELIEEYTNASKEITTTTYYEMSDGTWKTDEHTYQYKLVVTGRLHNAVADITYIILSNIKDITFEQAWKASGLSSNSADYFKAEDAFFVGCYTGSVEDSSSSEISTFSYEQVIVGCEENEPGVRFDGFKNTSECAVSNSQQAIERAKNEVNMEYNQIGVSYDSVADIWSVSFYKKRLTVDARQYMWQVMA